MLQYVNKRADLPGEWVIYVHLFWHQSNTTSDCCRLNDRIGLQIQCESWEMNVAEDVLETDN